MNVEKIDEKVFRIPEDSRFAPDPRGLGVLSMERMKKFKDNIAQIQAETNESATHGEILSRSIRVAQNLQKRNIHSDDIIVLCSYNNMDSCLPIFAGLFLGNRVAPLDPTLPKSDFIYLLNMVKPKFIFSCPESIGIIDTVLTEQNLTSEVIIFGETEKHTPFSELLVSAGDEDSFVVKPVNCLHDTAIIYFSSGTTGYPKGICATHYALQSHQEAILDAVDPSVMLYFTSYYWISASMILIMSVLAGTRRILCKRFDELTVMRFMQQYEVSLSLISTVHSFKLTQRYNSTDFDTSHLKSLMVVGTKISKQQIKTVKELFPHTQVTNTYGMTEINGCGTFFHSKRDQNFVDTKQLSCGRPTPGLTYKFVDIDSGETVGANQHGELRVKGNLLMSGYLNNPKETEEAFDSDGFFCTGDIGYYDEDYFVYIFDRIKSLIKYQSWRIVAVELEDILLMHPDVQDAIVIGIPDEVDGEHPAACVILKPGSFTTMKEILRFYDEKIEEYERYKLRGGLYEMITIPRTPSGKPQRRELRDLVLKGVFKQSVKTNI